MDRHERRRFLRSHFGDAITDRDEQEVRESFDNALEELQLLELAVACGFLTLEAVRSIAEPEFAALISSEPACEYLKIYNYVPVRYLAARLGIELGLGEVRPPAINHDAEVRFAMFLAMHYEFTASAAIRRFTRFMDDFVVGPNRIGAVFLKRRIESGGNALSGNDEAVVAEGCLGLVQFVEMLGDFFLQVPVHDQPYFGLAYSYWLSHFFGLRRTADRYEERGVSFEKVGFPTAVLGAGFDADAVNAESKRFQQGLETLKTVWDATRELIEGV